MFQGLKNHYWAQVLEGWCAWTEFQLLESDQGVGTPGRWCQLLEPVKVAQGPGKGGQRSCDDAQCICECVWDDGLDVVWAPESETCCAREDSASAREGGDVAMGGCVLSESCAVEGSTLPVAVCVTHTISVLSVALRYLLSFDTG